MQRRFGGHENILLQTRRESAGANRMALTGSRIDEAAWFARLGLPLATDELAEFPGFAEGLGARPGDEIVVLDARAGSRSPTRAS
jgi:hypothetical protein